MCMWMQTGPAPSHAALRSQGSSLHNGSPRLLRLASCLVRQAEERVCVCVFMCLRPPPSLSLSLCMCPALADFSLHCVCTTSGAIGVFIPSFVALFNALRRCHPALWARRRNEGSFVLFAHFGPSSFTLSLTLSLLPLHVNSLAAVTWGISCRSCLGLPSRCSSSPPLWRRFAGTTATLALPTFRATLSWQRGKG